MQKKGLAEDKTPKITIGIHYDHEQYGACSFSKEYDYIPAGKKTNSCLEGVMLTQKFDQYRTARLEEQFDGIKRQNQINGLKEQLKALRILHQKKNVDELDKKLKKE